MSPALRCVVSLAACLLAATVFTVAQTRPPVPGDALPGVTAAEFEEFRRGLDDFLKVETAEEGLGPAFNGTSCAACHPARLEWRLWKPLRRRQSQRSSRITGPF